MKEKEFHYLSPEIRLHSLLKGYGKGDCIVCQNRQLASILEAQLYHRSFFQERPKLISLEDFLDSICLTEKTVLKDIHRIFSLYQVLTAEEKQKWMLQSYFDFVDIANEFFLFYENIPGKSKEVEDILLPWQKEKFAFFESLYSRFVEKMEKENSIPKDWLYHRDYYDAYFLEQFEKITFFDIVSFPQAFPPLLEEMQQDIAIEFCLQMEEGDFDEEKLCLRAAKPSLFQGEMEAYRVASTWEEALFLLAEKEKRAFRIYSSKSTEKNFHQLYPKAFVHPMKSRFDESQLYQLMEQQLELLRKREQNGKQELAIVDLLKALQSQALRRYFGFWEEDSSILMQLLEEEYRMLSLDLLEHRRYLQVFGDHPDFIHKMKKFLESLWAIEDCRSISDIYRYFEEVLPLESLKEEAYPDVLDVFYEVLARLSNYEKNKNFGSYASYFEGAVGRSLYQLLFRSLHHIRLDSAEEFTPSKMEIRDWKNLPYEKEKELPSLFLDVDDASLPSASKQQLFLTEQQKESLGLRTREEEVLEEKYRFYQALGSQSSLIFVVKESEAENRTLSSFLEEFLWKQGREVSPHPYGKSYFLEALKQSFHSDRAWKKREEAYLPLEKENKELLNEEGRLVLGAYDWENLHACEKFFYFQKRLPMEKEVQGMQFGISPALLGSIAHKAMEEIGRREWKNFLNNREFAIQQKEVEEIFLACVRREYLKIPAFLSLYFKEILLPNFARNCMRFLRSVEKKYAGETMKRFQGEMGKVREDIYRGEDLDVVFKGRADLLIETNHSREIIDYKTGNTIPDQLAFYAFLFYGGEEQVDCEYYNLWEGHYLAKTKKQKEEEPWKQEDLEDFFREFEAKKHYAVSEKKAKCQYCAYVDICLREEEVECQEES